MALSSVVIHEVREIKDTNVIPPPGKNCLTDLELITFNRRNWMTELSLIPNNKSISTTGRQYNEKALFLQISSISPYYMKMQKSNIDGSFHNWLLIEKFHCPTSPHKTLWIVFEHWSLRQ